jgi:two-component system LytT family response regulator
MDAPNTSLGRLRVLVVDDEALSRAKILRRLECEPDVHVVGECADGLEALNAITRQTPDLVFLDIQMPELDGLGVVEALDEATRPVFVVVTAFRKHYARAFELQAVDYVVKPFTADRFAAALDHARTRVHERRAAATESGVGDLAARLRAVLAAIGVEPSRARPVAVHDRATGRWHLLAPETIDHVSVDGTEGVRVHVGRVTHPTSRSIARLERELAPHGFLRVHRCCLVNTARVRTAQALWKGKYELTLHDGTKLVTGSAFQRAVERLFE